MAVLVPEKVAGHIATGCAERCKPVHEAGKVGVHDAIPARQQAVRVCGLGYTLAKGAIVGEPVALDDGDTGKARGECSCREQSFHAGTEHDGRSSICHD